MHRRPYSLIQRVGVPMWKYHTSFSLSRQQSETAYQWDKTGCDHHWENPDGKTEAASNNGDDLSTGQHYSKAT